MNVVNVVLDHLSSQNCIGLTGPGEPPEDGEINEMTLPPRHRIRDWKETGGKETFVSLKPEFKTGGRARISYFRNKELYPL